MLTFIQGQLIWIQIMPAIQSPSKVLVSGANGSIATWIIRNLLEHGYSVRGTIRSANKGGHLEEYFGSYGDKFEVAIVEDITKVDLPLCAGELH